MFPGWASAFSDHVEQSLQVPTDLAAVTILGSLAAVLASEITVEAFPGWKQPECIWVAGVAVVTNRSGMCRPVGSLPDHLTDGLRGFAWRLRSSPAPTSRTDQSISGMSPGYSGNTPVWSWGESNPRQAF